MADYKIDFGCRINANVSEDVLRDLIEDYSDNLPKYLRYEDLGPNQQVKLMRRIFAHPYERSMVFTIEEMERGELMQRISDLDERFQEESFLDQSEFVQRVMEATKPEHKEYMSKILKGFPDLEQMRKASTEAKDNFSNALIRMALHKLFKIIEGNKISMKVANNLFDHVMKETTETFGFGLNKTKVDSYTRTQYLQKINGCHLPEFTFSYAEFDSFWKANMCSTIYRLVTSWDMDRKQNDGMFAPLGLEYSAAQESYLMPRTKLGLEFCQAFAKHCHPSLITAYYSNSDEETVAISGQSCTNNQGLVAENSLAADSLVTVEELSRVLAS